MFLFANLVLFNLKSLPKRIGFSLISVIGIAFVCAMLLSVSTLVNSFHSTFKSVEAYTNSLMIKSGSSSELNSYLSIGDIDAVKQLSQSILDSSKIAMSEEVYLVASLSDINNKDGNVAVRGLRYEGANLRPDFTILQGRWMESGKNELVIGSSTIRMYKDMLIGNSIELGKQQWEIVGVFDSGHAIANSEIWADVSALQGAFNRYNKFQLIYMSINESQVEQLQKRIENNPSVDLKIVSERSYYARQIDYIMMFIQTIGYLIVLIVSFSAIFIAANCMSVTISARQREITLYRSLGFSNNSIVAAMLFEAMYLALIGAIIATIISFFTIDNRTITFLNLTGTFNLQLLELNLSLNSILQSVFVALLLGFIAGIIPALLSVRVNLPESIRQC